MITYSSQMFESRLTKVKHVQVKHCLYALETIYLVFKHHSTREVIAVPRELKFIFNSYLGLERLPKSVFYFYSEIIQERISYWVINSSMARHN